MDFEFGLSNNDVNLYSSRDDNNNNGGAGKLNFKQRLHSKKWEINTFGNYQYIQDNFKTIERLFNIEFNRDWNLTTFKGNQSLLTNGIDFVLPQKGKLSYQFENLTFSKSFSGNRHLINGVFKLNNFNLVQNSSFFKK